MYGAIRADREEEYAEQDSATRGRNIFRERHGAEVAGEPAPKRPKAGIMEVREELIRASGHTIHRTPDKAECTACGRTASTAVVFRVLLNKPCKPELLGVPADKRAQLVDWLKKAKAT